MSESEIERPSTGAPAALESRLDEDDRLRPEFVQAVREAKLVPLADGRFDLDDYIDYLIGFLEAIGFARMAPEEPIREDELEVVALLQLGHASGFLDQRWSTRLGRGYQQGLRLIARA